jgi:lipopolysaccharide transport system permease protein
VVSAAVAAIVIDGVLALPVLLAVVAVLEGMPGVAALALWLPVGALLHLTFTLGIGLMLALANAFYRDVGIVLAPALAVLMFAAPVVYPPTLVPTGFRTVFLANPISAAIESYRVALLDTPPVAAVPLLAAALISFLLLVCGLVVAKRFDHRIREVL